MIRVVKQMSLRTRLALLAGFAIVAFLVAIFVAWRLARTTETFALRQADSAVHAAARDLAREVETNPGGYQAVQQATARPDHPSRDQQITGPTPRPVPPHVTELFAVYKDPLQRLTAITLHRYPNVAGGFYRASDAALIGNAAGGGVVAGPDTALPRDVAAVLRTLAQETVASAGPTSRVIQQGTDRIILVSYPTQGDEISAAWAFQRVSNVMGVSDWPNLAALLLLALSIMVVTGLALITVRQLKTGVADIESGLEDLTTDLSRVVTSPNPTELARIATAINELAASLRVNLVRQAELERELRNTERLSALGRVVAGVAHEIRNPLSAIKLKVQLAQRSNYSADQLNNSFSVITDEIERLDKLVRRLLELGSRPKLEFVDVDIGALVSKRAALVNELATDASIQIRVATQPEVLVSGEEDRLAQVIDNIVRNALEAMPAGGNLDISTHSLINQNGAGAVQIEFRDTGPGINPMEQEHVFEPFYTGRATGTGLGLAIARAIVEEHGGRLWFTSAPGSGSSFVMELPGKHDEYDDTSRPQ